MNNTEGERKNTKLEQFLYIEHLIHCIFYHTCLLEVGAKAINTN